MAPFTPLSPFSELQNARWPAPLAHQINRWLWLAATVSLGMMMTFACRIVNNLQYHTDNVNNDRKKQIPLALFALAVVGSFYDIALFVLSAKEQQLAENAEDQAVDEDPESGATSRSSLVFLMVVVCQNGLAALGLYIGIRVILFLRSPAPDAYESVAVACSELGYAMGQIGLMIYIIFQCMVHDAELGTCLRLHHRTSSPAKERL